MGTDTFHPPPLEIPTKVYRNPTQPGSFVTTSDDESLAVYPIKEGKIVDLQAFLYFLKLIYKSILNEKSQGGEKEGAFDNELNNIPFLLVSHHSWTRSHIEQITQYVFELLEINSFMILPFALATTYAFGSLQNSLVIDVGLEKTDLVPILDYTPIGFLSTTLRKGSTSVNAELEKLLPHLTSAQIEQLKKSDIYEVLSEDDKKNSFFGADAFEPEQDPDAEGALDVAAIVTSGRDTREILEERERKKNETNVNNTELETNSFVDSEGNQVSVGKQRFQGCEPLIKQISLIVGQVLSQIDDMHKLRSIWENILVVGNTSMIKGFKEALLVQLCKDHLIIEPDSERQLREQEALSQAALTKKKNKFMNTPFMHSLEYLQAPTIIKLAKFPEYFPEWKKHGYGEVGFLGAQIVSKQVFGHNNDSFFVTREKYERVGPSAVWDVSF